MGLHDLTSDAVRKAIAEHDRLGQDRFLERHGFGRARDYLLVLEGRRYDSKAIAGVAHGYLPGSRPLRANEFSGGSKTVQAALGKLGFKVLGPGELPSKEELDNADRRRERELRKRDIAQLRRLARSAKQAPARRLATTERIDRSPAIAAYVKKAACGCCDLCGQPAPFEDREREPFLECHHVQQLAHGGSDTVENAVALCPNCHRRMHVLASKTDVIRLRQIIRERERRIEPA